MQKIEGLYSAITAIIRQRESENKLAIEASDIVESVKKEVDIYSASIDWLVQTVLKQAVMIGLYSNGYRSVVKGYGFFVNQDNVKKPEYLKRLFNNAKLTEMQKKQVALMLEKKAKSSVMDGQLVFDPDTCMIVEDITERQLIEMLIKDAKAG